MGLILNQNHIQIIQDICEIQLESLSDIPSVLRSPEKKVLYQEMGLAQEQIMENWGNQCKIFIGLQEDPEKITTLEEIDLLIVGYILLHHEQNWRYRFPVAFAYLRKLIIELLEKDTVKPLFQNLQN
jgi:hypothetical protein